MRKLGEITYMQQDGCYAPTKVKIVAIIQTLISDNGRSLLYNVKLLEDLRRPNGDLITSKDDSIYNTPCVNSGLLRNKLTAEGRNILGQDS
jgi:hypothetical protein